MSKLLFGGLIFTGILISSCSTETGVEAVNGTNPVKATYSSIATIILDNRCAKSGCHLDSQNPHLSSSEAYDNIVSKKNAAGTLNYIEQGNPDDSYLYQKLLENGNRTGKRMPRDGETSGYLSQVELDSIRTWIENGALNN